MTKPNGSKLPADAADLKYLHIELCDSRQIRPSIEAELVARGQLFVVDGKNKLASRQAYLDALASFCATVGIPVDTIGDGYKVQRYAEQDQRRQSARQAPELAKLKGA